jgi:hypothetical protein
MGTLLSQKNQIFDIIESNGMSPTNFAWEEVNGPITDLITIRHKFLDYYFTFIFDSTDRQFTVTAIPWEDNSEGKVNAPHWNMLRLYFDVWLKCIQKESGLIDK